MVKTVRQLLDVLNNKVWHRQTATDGSETIYAGACTLHTVNVNSVVTNSNVAINDGGTSIATIDSSVLSCKTFDCQVSSDLRIVLSSDTDVTVTYCPA